MAFQRLVAAVIFFVNMTNNHLTYNRVNTCVISLSMTSFTYKPIFLHFEHGGDNVQFTTTTRIHLPANSVRSGVWEGELVSTSRQQFFTDSQRRFWKTGKISPLFSKEVHFSHVKCFSFEEKKFSCWTLWYRVSTCVVAFQLNVELVPCWKQFLLWTPQFPIIVHAKLNK